MTHTCGPESNCDMECMTREAFAKLEAKCAEGEKWKDTCLEERDITDRMTEHMTKLESKCAELSDNLRVATEVAKIEQKKRGELTSDLCTAHLKIAELSEQNLELVAQVKELIVFLQEEREHHKKTHRFSGPDMMCGYCRKLSGLICSPIPDPSFLSREIEKAVAEKYKTLVEALEAHDKGELKEPSLFVIFNLLLRPSKINEKDIAWAESILAQFTKSPSEKSEQVAGPGVADYERIVGQMSKSEEGKRK